MNPTYKKIQVDFLNKGERLMSDAEWEKKQKILAADQKKQADKKARKRKREEKRAREQEDKERKANRCPHCGQDRRSGDTGKDKLDSKADKEKERREEAEGHGGFYRYDDDDDDGFRMEYPKE